MAEFELELGRKRERNVEPIGRQKAIRAVRPFEQHHRALGQVVEAELGELRRSRQAVEVGMDQWKLWQLVDLHQREGRARHLDRRVAGEIADERAHERGLAGPEIARERDEVAGFQRIGDVDGEPAGGVLIGQRHREARCGGGGQGHGMPRRPLARIGVSFRELSSQSCAGLTRASISFARRSLPKRMDCRVKPGNDGLNLTPIAFARAWPASVTPPFARALIEREDAGTVVPRPTADSSDTEPPCSSTNERTRERPRPVPRWREPSEWVSNQSNTLSCTSAGMPGPRSVTENTTASLRRWAANVTISPPGEKPTALAKRLNSNWRTRRSSAMKVPISGAARISSRMPFLTRRSCTPSAAASMVLRISTAPRLSVMAPASMLA